MSFVTKKFRKHEIYLYWESICTDIMANKDNFCEAFSNATSYRSQPLLERKGTLFVNNLTCNGSEDKRWFKYLRSKNRLESYLVPYIWYHKRCLHSYIAYASFTAEYLLLSSRLTYKYQEVFSYITLIYYLDHISIASGSRYSLIIFFCSNICCYSEFTIKLKQSVKINYNLKGGD